ncbi:hypothetical protein ACYOEI_01575 [Singulisphaera rosea]
MKRPMTGPLRPASQVAVRLGKPRSEVIRLALAGRIKTVMEPGRPTLYVWADVEALAAEQAQADATSAKPSS